MVAGDQITKVVYSFLRRVLGVSKTTSNFGILSETGKFPIILKAYIQIMKYWVRLLSTKNEYAQNTHLSNLQQWKNNKTSWIKIVDYLLIYTDMKQNINLGLIISKPNLFIKEFENKILLRYRNFWKYHTSSKRETKLNFYFKVKKNNYFEKYLDTLKKESREIVSKFRLSNHFLPIEKLRYQKIPREERICPICDINEVGDEMHYLLKCKNKNMKLIREDFKKYITDLQSQFKYFDSENIIIYCMSRAIQIYTK